MVLLGSILGLVDKVFPATPVFAHCDIPCGIYDPKPAQIAAATVLKMVGKIEALPKENPTIQDRNSFVRMVSVKEEHSQLCKKELLILWTDFFKPEHLEQFPNLHDKFWQAAKLCSQNKQEVNNSAAQELVGVVDDIAEMFEKAKANSKK